MTIEWMASLVGRKAMCWSDLFAIDPTAEGTGAVKRGVLGSCSHPNSEWIDYDGLLPDTPASSAIKALLEFRSLPG